MPCASVLILELFRQNRQPHRPATLNRSTLVQDISVLISCCDSLAISGQSNYQICKQAQTVFSRCLDQILNQTAVSSPGLTSEPGGPEVQEPFSLDLTDFGLTELYPQDPEWSMWLESFDLYQTWLMAEQSPWIVNYKAFCIFVNNYKLFCPHYRLSALSSIRAIPSLDQDGH